jgi:integrase
LATTQNALVTAFKTAKKRYMAECHANGVDPTSLLDLRWHDLRHEAASRLSERGFDAIRVAAVTGHRPGSMQMVARYVHTESESLVAMLG